MTRSTASSIWMRTSIMDERPTVSIQNGSPICLRISADNELSSSEKKGLGSGGGSGCLGRMSTSSPRRSKAMRSSLSSVPSAGRLRWRSTSAATSWVSATDRR